MILPVLVAALWSFASPCTGFDDLEHLESPAVVQPWFGRVPTCQRCGSEAEGAFGFCPECGAEAPSGPPVQAQRKTVTVLFCDLAGSTALGETLDPERLRELLARYFERMRAIAELHGGTRCPRCCCSAESPPSRPARFDRRWRASSGRGTSCRPSAHGNGSRRSSRRVASRGCFLATSSTLLQPTLPHRGKGLTAPVLEMG